MLEGILERVPPVLSSACVVAAGGDRNVATKKIAKELKKLQAESAVLQEHSRRLHGKALDIQQRQERQKLANQVQLLPCPVYIPQTVIRQHCPCEMHVPFWLTVQPLHVISHLTCKYL
jgi:hypothetical protein